MQKSFGGLGAAVLAIFVWGSVARAQTVQSFDLERLTLNPGAEDSLVVGTGRLLPAGHFRILALVHEERAPLSLETSVGTLGALVRNRLSLDLAAAYSVTDSVQIDAELPIILHQWGDSVSARGIAAPSKAGLGAPWLGVRWRLLSQAAGMPLTLAVGLGLGLPVGSSSGYARDTASGGLGGLGLLPRIEASHDFHHWLLGIQVGALARRATALPSGQYGSAIRLDLVAATRGHGIRGELALRSAISLSGAPFAAELLGGLRVPVGGGFQLFALGGPGLTQSPGTPSFRVLAGVGFVGGPSAAPAPVAASVAVDPCAANAPNRALECPTLDFDHDGIANRDDLCPKEAEDRDGFQDTDGCPDADNDRDGLADAVDHCPNVAGAPKYHGCAIEPVQAKFVAEQLESKHEITFSDDQVRFDFGKATLSPAFEDQLDQVAKAMLAHPEIKQVEVRGYTDDVGATDYNLALSERRAEAARDYLVKKGVAASRLTAKGFGEADPIAPNTTKDGRAKNRRVVFEVMSR